MHWASSLYTINEVSNGLSFFSLKYVNIIKTEGNRERARKLQPVRLSLNQTHSMITTLYGVLHLQPLSPSHRQGRLREREKVKGG